MEKGKTTITGEQLFLALSYLIFWELEVQGEKYPENRRQELLPILSRWRFRTNEFVIRPLLLPEEEASYWMDISYMEFPAVQDSLFVLFGFVLLNSDRSRASFDVDAVARMFEPNAYFNHVHLSRPNEKDEEKPKSLQSAPFRAIRAYLNAFACGEITERDLVSA